MNRRSFFKLVGAAGVAASTNPVRFLAPTGGWHGKNTYSFKATLGGHYVTLCDSGLFSFEPATGRTVKIYTTMAEAHRDFPPMSSEYYHAYNAFGSGRVARIEAVCSTNAGRYSQGLMPQEFA
jgi:hypothetical protein